MPRSEIAPERRIRSFIRRQGRITPGQQQAIDSLWKNYCLNPKKHYNYSEVFGRQAPLFIEIGFGNGESLAAMAAANPHQDFIGIEVHKPGIGHLMLRLDQLQLSNVKIYCHDAYEILEQRITDSSLDGVHLFFPDPWPKKRHHKRRIVRPDFAALITKKLKQNAYFHAATDWENYAEQMLTIFHQASGMSNTCPQQSFCDRPDYRPVTKFEQRGLRLGHGVWDLVFRKTG